MHYWSKSKVLAQSFDFALWVDRITKKASIGTSPFRLVYGKEAVLPLKLVIPSTALVQFINEQNFSSLQSKLYQTIKMEEEREKAKMVYNHHQQLIKISFDSNTVKLNSLKLEIWPWNGIKCMRTKENIQNFKNSGLALFK